MKNIWKRLRTINTNSIIAVSAVIISLCALLVSLQEVRLMRQQQKANMYPYLSLSNDYSGEGFGLSIRNSGSGLARINSVQLTDGEQHFRNWLDVIQTYLPDSLQFGYDLLRANTLNDRILIPGEEMELFFVQWTPATRMLEEDFRDLDMIICYSSLLDDYWELRGGKHHTLNGPCEQERSKEFN